MKKLFFVLFAALLLGSCSTDSGDSPDSLPSVDTDSFKTETGFLFSKGASALEIYKTLYEEYGLGEFSVTGTYKHTESETLNGQVYSNTLTKSIKGVRIYKTDTPASHLFHVDFTFTDSSTIKFYYQWQYYNDNAWHNNKSDGVIKLTKS